MALKADEAVGIVLEYEEVVLVRESDKPAAALVVERSAARILERRDRVEEGRLCTARKRLLEGTELEPLVIHRHGRDADAGCGQYLERPVVGR